MYLDILPLQFNLWLTDVESVQPDGLCSLRSSGTLASYHNRSIFRAERYISFYYFKTKNSWLSRDKIDTKNNRPIVARNFFTKRPSVRFLFCRILKSKLPSNILYISFLIHGWLLHIKRCEKNGLGEPVSVPQSQSRFGSPEVSRVSVFNPYQEQGTHSGISTLLISFS